MNRYMLLDKNMIKNEEEKSEIFITIKNLESLTPFQLDKDKLKEKYNYYYEKYPLKILKFEFEMELYIYLSYFYIYIIEEA